MRIRPNPTPRIRKNGDRYHLVFYNPKTKRRKEVSLGTTKKGEALSRAAPVITKYEAGELDPFEGHVDVFPLTLLEALGRFTGYCRERVQEGSMRKVTADDYENGLASILAPLPGGLLIRDLNADHVRQCVYRDDLASATRRGYYVRLRRFLRWLVSEGYLKENPADVVRPPRKPEAIPQFLTREEATRVLNQLEQEGQQWLHRAVSFALATGLRKSELVRLRMGDIESKLIRIRGAEAKSHRDRLVPLFPLARAVYDARLAEGAAPSDPVLVTPEGKAIGHDHLSKSVRRAFDRAGLRKRLHLHSLRHTFASWLRLDNVGLDRIRDWMGHRTYEQTLVYAQITPADVAEEGAATFSLNPSPPVISLVSRSRFAS